MKIKVIKGGGGIKVIIKNDCGKIKWHIHDIIKNSSANWSNLLHNGPTNSYISIGGSGRDNWRVNIKNNNFILCFDIYNSNFGSTIEYAIPMKEMMPAVEQIINIIKEAK